MSSVPATVLLLGYALERGLVGRLNVHELTGLCVTLHVVTARRLGLGAASDRPVAMTRTCVLCHSSPP
jgi:hypothetical protein